MPAQILELIDRSDNFELVRDQIASILLVESTNQVAIANATPGKNAALWKLRIFTERSNPWEQFQDPPDASDSSRELEFDNSPIVNVSFDTLTPDPSTSDIVERQKVTGNYNIDVYARGVSADDPDGVGHVAGDEQGSFAVQRAVRLVRSVLMAGTYVRLGFPLKPNAVVWKRWVQSITAFQPVSGEHVIQHVKAARIAFAVDFNEFSPQVQGVPLLVVGTGFRRADTGEIFLLADFQTGA